MAKRQETCKQQCCNQIFNECNIRTGWNTLPDRRHKRDKSYQQGRYRNHSFPKPFCLKKDSQVQNRQQPQWEENDCNGIHWVLVQRNHYECVLVRAKRLIIRKTPVCHSWIFLQVSLFIFSHHQTDIPLITVFTKPQIFLTHLSVLLPQNCVLLQPESFLQVFAKPLKLLLLHSSGQSLAPWRIPNACEILELLFTQHFVIVVTDVHFWQHQSITAKLFYLTYRYFLWNVFCIHEVEVHAESAFWFFFSNGNFKCVNCYVDGCFEFFDRSQKNTSQHLRLETAADCEIYTLFLSVLLDRHVDVPHKSVILTIFFHSLLLWFFFIVLNFSLTQ